MQFISETSSNGVLERHFILDEITGVLWSPASGIVGAPLLLAGHSGGMHKKAPGLLASALHFVTNYGFTVAAIDAPGHGGREPLGGLLDLSQRQRGSSEGAARRHHMVDERRWRSEGLGQPDAITALALAPTQARETRCGIVDEDRQLSGLVQMVAVLEPHRMVQAAGVSRSR